MNEFVYQFSNLNDFSSNHVVYPGAPFFLEGFRYRTIISSEMEGWRFGIRLSIEENISIVEGNIPDSQAELYLEISSSPEHPSDNLLYIFLMYVVSNHEPKVLHVARFTNLERKVEFDFEYDASTNALDIKYYVDELTEHFEVLELELPFRCFKIFSWSNNEILELEAKVKIISEIEISEPDGRLFPFQVGNILFRLGDMFDTYASHNNALTVFPVANDGLLRGIFHDKIKDLSIPFPLESEAGNIIVHKTSSNVRYPYVAYAYSVNGTQSSPEIISSICVKVLSAYLENSQNVSLKKVINMPLLGTGAGKMDSLSVVKIYDEEFNHPYKLASILVNIQNSVEFEKIRTYFLGRFISQNGDRIYKPAEIIQLEEQFSIEVDISSFSFNTEGQISHLTLSDIRADRLEFLREFFFLESLTITNSLIEDYSFLVKLPFLVELHLIKSNVVDLNFLESISLVTLTINSLSVENFNFLVTLDSLEHLTIVNCQLNTIDFLRDITKLKTLNLSRCSLTMVAAIRHLDKLQNLNLSENFIVDISPISSLSNLTVLILNDNRIIDISVILKLEKLTYLRAEGNPFVKKIKLIINQNENHLQVIRNYYSRQKESNKVEVSLPAKVILLGNHASGKSSLLKFILDNLIEKAPESTHLVKIEKYWNGSGAMPEAIFFDFGGQDYYHGIYRAFLSSGSLYLILWDKSNNRNQQRLDSKNIYTQDFSLSYWLSQKKYLENEKYEGNVDPIFVIQSRSDIDTRGTFSDYANSYKIDNEFFVSLKPEPTFFEEDFAISNFHSLHYLKSSIQRQINAARTITEEPVWYSKFLDYILSQGKLDRHDSRSVTTDIFPNYKKTGPNKLASLQEDLDQLHKRGLILYYKNEIPDRVWLNPESLVAHVHDEILNAKEIGKYEGKIPESEIKKFEPEVINLLCKQKVIFKHDLSDTVEYIAPNFLPLVDKLKDDFSLFTFDLGQPSFALKFLNFLPFGIINQLICLFKNEPDDTKKFWRNQLLFTFKKKSKILIHVDFELLEIKVHSFFKKDVPEGEKVNIHKYLFFCILSVYWDLPMLEYDDYVLAIRGNLKKEDFDPDSPMQDKIDSYQSIYEKRDCRPLDLFISIDMKHFVNYEHLCSLEKDSQMISSRIMNSDGFLSERSISIPIYTFQNFTQRNLKRVKKVVISYSKRDLKLVNKFKDYLVPLHQNGLIESPWYCTDLIAGQEWNEEIKQKFSEADIVFFMISENLMVTRYVLDNEIKDAIDRWERDKSIKIVPIILEPYNFARNGPYNLARFTALPYTLQPITEFPNQKLAWHAVSESIRIMIEKDVNPEYPGELTTELKQIFEKIIKQKID